MLKKSDVVEAVSKAENETFVLGECVFIRTVTFHMIGRIVRISNIGPNYFLHLEDATWVAESGPWSEAIDKGKVKDHEPTQGIVRLNIASITDAFPWNHPLPRTKSKS